MKFAKPMKSAKMENANSFAHKMRKENVKKMTRYYGLTAAEKKARFILSAMTIYLETSAKMGSAA